MAIPFVAAIDLLLNEIQNGTFQALASDPGSPVARQFWYNTTANEFRYYDGTAVQRISAAYLLARANHTGTQAASTISDFDTQVRTSRLDQLAAPTNPVGFNNQRLTSVATPISATDAATKGYADTLATGLDVKASVRAATTANITLSGAQTIDGVSVIAGDRVLVKDQSTGSQNGIYVAAAGAWGRSTDADTDAEVTAGLFTFVEAGTANGDKGFVLTTDNPITVGTTALAFTAFSGATDITAGAGLTKTGTTLDVVGTANRIIANTDSIDISSSYVGQASITTLGTITTGVWTGTDVAVADGGTGSSTAAGARTNLGAVGKYSALIGNSSSTSFTINQSTHGLAADSTNLVQVTDASSGKVVLADVTVAPGTGNVTVAFSTAPASNAYRVTIFG